MPKLVIQATTISGKLIEAAKWVVEPPAGLQEGQIMSINLPIKDPALIKYIGKQRSFDCLIDKDKDGYNISMACTVSRIRHMAFPDGNVDSLAFLVPTNRIVEHTMLYILNPSKCDPRFVHAVRSELGKPPV